MKTEVSFAKNILASLGITATASAIHAGSQKKKKKEKERKKYTVLEQQH